MIQVRRLFTQQNISPFDSVQWSPRNALILDYRKIQDGKPRVAFQQDSVEFPTTWSQQAVDIVTSKYFRGKQGTPEREVSLKQVIGRVAEWLENEGIKQGYFDKDTGLSFSDELSYILLNQYATFNSPVWFNVGVFSPPQCSACFILEVDDHMESILDWVKLEGMIFKGGSGSGVSLKNLRSSYESLSSGGVSSGPMSFAKGADAMAGAIKSGGKTRRAAKMLVLPVDHLDIEKFIACKVHEEKKLKALKQAGFEISLDGDEAFYQNANNSVRVTDEFMRAVVGGKKFTLRGVKDPIKKDVDARDLLMKISKAAWECGDPGLQYDTTINNWHTSHASGRINASNPCLSGDTFVFTAQGPKKIKDLVGRKDVYVYGYSEEKGRIAAAKATKIWKTRKNAELIEVTFSYGRNNSMVSSMKVTPDHRFQLRDGSYLKAEKLEAGESLMPFQVSIDRKGYVRIGLNNEDSFPRFGHRIVAEDILGGEIRQQGDEVWHHKDGRKTNNHPSNLVRKIDSVHNSEHMMGDLNPARRLMNDEWKENISKAVSGRGNPRAYKAPFHKFVKAYKDIKRTKGRVTTALWNSYIRLHSANLPLSNIRGVQGMSWDEFECACENNHKVVSVKRISIREDVYDMTVPDLGNFAAGDENGYVIVHNCSEYMFVDNSACNLASINLVKFLRNDGTFDTDKFKHVVDIFILAQDIIVDGSSYPSPEITKNSHRLRPLGLGYANLGSLLMRKGLPYDSDEGRAYAASITALMHCRAYRKSAELAEAVGPYEGLDDEFTSPKGEGWKTNRDNMLDVLKRHRHAAEGIGFDIMSGVDPNLLREALDSADEACSLATSHGVRNGQVTVIAPTGTISFMLDCDTTGCEPAIQMVATKTLVGGGTIPIVYSATEEVLKNKYTPQQAKEISEYIISTKGRVKGAPHLKQEHYSLFDTALGWKNKETGEVENALSPMAHIKMMSSIQPFLSGAISKTVNMPETTTPEDIFNTYVESWKLGLKSLALYRDNCKAIQPVTTALSEAKDTKVKEEGGECEGGECEDYEIVKWPLPEERPSVTTKFHVGEFKGYLTVGVYPDTNRPGEIFMRGAKAGTTLSGFIDAFATAVSIGLQYGVPLEKFVETFKGMDFAPRGFTGREDVRSCSSIPDLVFRWIEKTFLKGKLIKTNVVALKCNTPHPIFVQRLPLPWEREDYDPTSHHHSHHQVAEGGEEEKLADEEVIDDLCPQCGGQLVRSGSCQRCLNCGSQSGCG